jgi:hypothetical protein
MAFRCGSFGAGLRALALGALGVVNLSCRSAGPNDPAPAARSTVEPGGPGAVVESIRARFVAHGAGPSDTKPEPILGPPVLSIARDGVVLRPQVTASLLAATRKPARVELPETAAGAFTLTDATSGMRAEVTLLGAAAAPAEVTEGYVVYRGALPGAEAVHRPTPEGTEDFFAYDRRPAQEELRYALALGQGVAGLRLVGGVLELVDADGTPRLRMAAPYVVGADGMKVAATTDVEGCAVDRDPRAPWGRAPTSPGADRCEVRVSWEGVPYPALVDPTWNTTGSMTAGRASFTTTLLGTGNVLAAGGGDNPAGAISSAELYNPTSATWAATATMAQPHGGHTASLLASGDVLIASGGATAVCELYDPSTGRFTVTASMAYPRWLHTATVLANGKVLVVGGGGSSNNPTTPCTSAEIYNPAGGTWALAGNTAAAHCDGAAAVLLGSADVLVVGGTSAGPQQTDASQTCVFASALSAADLYNPTTNTWSSAASMISARCGPTATTLANGTVLVAGGINGFNPVGTGEIYDPSTNAFSNAGNMVTARGLHTASVLSNGRVLLAGGENQIGGRATSAAEIYDPVGGAFGAASAMNAGRLLHAATVLPGGVVLAAGGDQFAAPFMSGQGSAELFTLAAPGATCASALECLSSGFCADGICCSTACTGACVACSAAQKGSGADGTCGPVGVGLKDPSGICTVAAASTCANPGTCNGSGACQPYYPAGAACSPSSCASASSQNNASTCDGAGNCVANGASSCAAHYACGGTGFASSCATSCTTYSDCDTTSFCNGTTCVGLFSNGAACTAASQCVSGFCASGVCCNTACGSECTACSAAAKGGGVDGSCGPVAAGQPDPTHQCAIGAVSTCAKPGTCDGSGACQPYYPAGVVCAATSCASPTSQQNALTCDGMGNCATNGTTTCSPHYACGGKGCLTSCTSDSNCDAMSWCSGGACVGQGSNGTPCTAADQCGTGFCQDGVCCDTSCGGCSACTAAKKGSGSDGTCGPVAAGTNPNNLCTVGPDYPASCLSDGECDGAGSCRQFAVSGIACGTTTCSGGLQVGFACNGAGSCVSQTVQCAPFVCGGVACGVSCASDGDCVAGSYCNGSACQPRLADGQACVAADACSSGFCADGVCCNQPCTGQCESCGGAAPGMCTPVTGAPQGSRPACQGAGTTCGGTCNGTQPATCTYPPGPTPCGSTCTNGRQSASVCDGQGACTALNGTDCAPYVCGASACKTACATNADCASGYACKGQACEPEGTVCDGAHILKNPDGTTTDCSPYGCAGAACKTSCVSVADCASPAACDLAGACIAFTPAATDGAMATCTAASHGERGAVGGVGGMALVAVAAGLRRRRRAAPEQGAR